MTIYFPLIVSGAMLIGPTESVGRQELDQFIEAMRSIAKGYRKSGDGLAAYAQPASGVWIKRRPLENRCFAGNQRRIKLNLARCQPTSHKTSAQDQEVFKENIRCPPTATMVWHSGGNQFSAHFLYACTPRIVIDGNVMLRPWGVHSIPLEPGMHQVRIYFHYLFTAVWPRRDQRCGAT